MVETPDLHLLFLHLVSCPASKVVVSACLLVIPRLVVLGDNWPADMQPTLRLPTLDYDCHDEQVPVRELLLATTEYECV